MGSSNDYFVCNLLAHSALDPMQHQCFQLATTLNPAEWRRFLVFAKLNHSRFSGDLGLLLETMAALHPSFEIDDPSLWQATFPDREFDNPRLRVLRSYLKDLLEEFIILLELENDETKRQLLLAKALLRRNGHYSVERLLSKIRRELPKPAMRIDDWEYALELDELALSLAVQQHQLGPQYPWGPLLDAVKRVALMKQLNYLASIAATKGFFAIRNEQVDRHIEETLLAADSDFLREEPLAEIFHRLLLLLLGRQSEWDPSDVLQMLAIHSAVMDREDRWNVYLLLVNHFFEQQRQRVPGSLEMAFKVFQEMHRQDILFGKEASTESTLRTIIQVGIRLGEIEWTRSFVDEVHTRIEPAARERFFRYGSALLDFGEGKFIEAKRHLARFEITTSAERLYHDNLMMRICYEINDADGLEVVSSVLLRHLYRKEKIAESTKKAAINLAKAVVALFDQRWSPKPTMSRPELHGYIGKLQPISHLDWIEAKLTELQTLFPDN